MTPSFAMIAVAIGLGLLDDAKTKQTSAVVAVNETLPWTAGLKRTLAGSLRSGKPILVRAGAPWCEWCTKLDAEVKSPTAQKELERWSLAYVDADRDVADARRLGIGPIPALRILTAEGRSVAARDGFLSAADLAAWLKENYDSAAVKPIDELLDSAVPTGPGLARLVRELEQRDPVLREAAIRRLVASPSTTAAAIERVLEDGSLQARLAALDVLLEWKAPAAGFDPWRPETFTAPRLTALRNWVKSVPTNAEPKEPAPLTPAERASAAADVERMLTAPDQDVSAFRERIARLGKRAVPIVYEAFKKADTDSARQRLTALRYRIAASPALAIHWRSGLERLSAPENDVRHQAAEELVQRSGAAEEDLLLELFGDEDPLVRELALRGLYESSGGGVAGVLVRLLQDPSPNVRAAVLKQLAERPSPALLPKLKEYVKTESDPDLVVHAVRVFRETKSKSSTDALLKLFQHPNWRVRAEALEAVGGAIGKHYEPENADRTAAFDACLPLLEDPDPFVVGRAAGVLEHDDDAEIVGPLVKAVEKQPPLAATVLVALANGAKTKKPSIKHLRRLAKSNDALHRAAAITALAASSTEEFEAEAKAGLADSVVAVRVAALDAMFSELERVRRPRVTRLGIEPEPPPLPPPANEPDFFSLLFGLNSRSQASATKTTTKEVKPKGPPKAKAEANAKTGESEYDEWLRTYRKGPKRPEWMLKEKARLDQSLTSKDADERLSSALVTTALGLSDAAIPTLLKAVVERPTLTAKAAAAIPWQPFAERLELFRRLTAGIAPEDLRPVAFSMAEIRDPRAEEPLWALFDGGPRDERIASDVHGALQKVYFGDYYYDLERIPAGDRKLAVKSLDVRVGKGPEWARSAALALYAVADREAADGVAEKWLSAKTTPLSLRRDAMQLRLLLASKTEARKLAVQAVKDGDETILEPALTFLAMGQNELRLLRQTFDLYGIAAREGASMGSQERGKIPEPPKGLTVESLRPLLTKAGPRGAAVAGYFMVLLDEMEGLDPLVTYWKKSAATDADWIKLVYQAVSYSGDDRYVSVLEQIYSRTKGNESIDVADLYWSMRPMEGPRARALRARIRKEVGMERLK